MVFKQFVNTWELAHLADLQCKSGKLSGEKFKESLVLLLIKHLRENFFRFSFLHFRVLTVFGLCLRGFIFSKYLFNNLDNTAQSLCARRLLGRLHHLVQNSALLSALSLIFCHFLFSFLLFLLLLIKGFLLCTGGFHLIWVDAEFFIVFVQLGIRLYLV